jgi:hypothetical protein
VPEVSVAVVQRLTTALEMVDRISGIATAPEDPARAVEAATTVLLREKKAVRALARVFSNYTDYQRNVSRRMLEAIAQAMPVEQILEILSADARYTYMPGGDAQGPQQMMQGQQMMPPQTDGYGPNQQMPSGPHIMDNELQKAVEIEELRNTRYNVQLEASSDSEAYRTSQLRVLLEVLGVSQGAIAVDPEIILELAAGSRSMRERLLQFQRQSSQTQAQAAQMQTQGQAQLIAAQAGAFQAEAQARTLTAQSDAQQGDQKLAQDRVKEAAQSLLDLLTIWERADGVEKKFIQQAGSQLQ